MRALGQAAAARIEVLEDALRVDVSLPRLLAKAAKRLLPMMRNEVRCCWRSNRRGLSPWLLTAFTESRGAHVRRHARY